MEYDDVAVQVALEEEDHTAFLDYYLAHHPRGRRIRPNAWIFAIVAILFYLSIQWRDPGRNPDELAPFVIGAFISGGLLLGAFVVLLRFGPGLLMQAAVRLGPRKHTLEETLFAFDREGIRIESAAGRGKLAWNNVEGIGETERHLFILLGGLNAFIVPKRVFEDDAEAGRFSAYLRAHAATPRS